MRGPRWSASSRLEGLASGASCRGPAPSTMLPQDVWACKRSFSSRAPQFGADAMSTQT